MLKRELRVVCLMLLSCMGIHAQETGAVKKLEAMDYIEIQQLYVRYTQAIDFQGLTDGGLMYASVFTRDGIFDAGPNTVCKGYDQLVACGKKFTESQTPPWLHMTMTPLIEPTAEGAIATAYLTTMRSGGKGKPPYPSVTATYTDTLVKTAEGWRFKSRIFRDVNTPGFVVPPHVK